MVEDLYSICAQYYDPIYHFKDYAAEANRLHSLLQGRGVKDGACILEVACGTGNYLVALREWYDVAGLDSSEAMLEIASAKLPDVSLGLDDMVRFEVDHPYDAILCLFSSIAHLRSEEALRNAAGRFAAATRPGGLVLVEPFVTSEVYQEGRPWIDTYRSDDLHLCRAVVSERAGEHAVLDFHWLVVPRGASVQHLRERQVLWMCPRPTMIRVFEDAGFECQWLAADLNRDRELLVGTRQG
ncbi:MAG: class I SAM-dependent methyltransferase [Myxococcota bacterium]